MPTLSYSVVIVIAAFMATYFNRDALIFENVLDRAVEFIKQVELHFKGKSCLPQGEKMFTKEQLKRYDGSPGSDGLYLAYLGQVYDVSKGAKHYGPGGSYAIFAGKDASRAFITGEFEEGGLLEDVEGLELGSFGGIREWDAFYNKDYLRVGRLVGAYYDQSGCPTDRIAYLETMYKKFDEKEDADNDEEKLFPPCNSEWNGDDNTQLTRFWCSTLSGGIERNWIGVPRQLYILETKSNRCACVRPEGPPSMSAIEYADEEDEEGGQDQVSAKRPSHDNGDLSHPRLREYDNCDPMASECTVKV